MFTEVGFEKAAYLSIAFEPDVEAGGPAGSRPGRGTFADSWEAAGREADRLMAERQAALDLTVRRERKERGDEEEEQDEESLAGRVGKEIARIARGLTFTRPAAVHFPPVDAAAGSR
jgi:hypothetical protein